MKNPWFDPIILTFSRREKEPSIVNYCNTYIVGIKSMMQDRISLNFNTQATCTGMALRVSLMRLLASR